MHGVLELCLFCFVQVLSRDLVRALQGEWPTLELEHVILHMDNTLSHTAHSMQLVISLRN